MIHNHWKTWVHVTKLDPDKRLTPEAVADVATSGTDALMISGTLNITLENVSALKRQLEEYGLPLVVEPAGPEAVIFEGVEFVFVPSVLNSTDIRWIVGKHWEWVKNQKVDWEKVADELEAQPPELEKIFQR